MGGETVLKIQYQGKLEKILTNERLLKKEYTQYHRNIISRMVELSSVDDLSEISTSPPPIRHKLTGTYEGCWAVWYSKNDRIVFRPIGEYNIEDIKTIKEIIIIFVGDYH
ncbi:MAG TPA: plasmid maintenance system killer protein [Clostridiales bacterium]|nr:plasmid maintenance system killer protein [Clostridiales bacterium]